MLSVGSLVNSSSFLFSYRRRLKEETSADKMEQKPGYTHQT